MISRPPPGAIFHCFSSFSLSFSSLFSTYCYCFSLTVTVFHCQRRPGLQVGDGWSVFNGRFPISWWRMLISYWNILADLKKQTRGRGANRINVIHAPRTPATACTMRFEAPARMTMCLTSNPSPPAGRPCSAKISGCGWRSSLVSLGRSSVLSGVRYSLGWGNWVNWWIWGDKMMNFVWQTRNCVSKTRNFVYIYIQNDDVLQIEYNGWEGWANLPQVSFQRKNPDFRLKNPDFRLKNADFRLKNADFRLKNAGFGLKNVDLIISNRSRNASSTSFAVCTRGTLCEFSTVLRPFLRPFYDCLAVDFGLYVDAQQRGNGAVFISGDVRVDAVCFVCTCRRLIDLLYIHARDW